jgi:hypothetical protein
MSFAIADLGLCSSASAVKTVKTVTLAPAWVQAAIMPPRLRIASSRVRPVAVF